MRAIRTLMLVVVSALAGACDGAGSRTMDGTGDTLAVAPTDADTSSRTLDSAGNASAAETGHAHSAEGEGEALLPIMQKLGASMTSITYGLMTDDGAMVVKGAAAIADHVPIAPMELERIRGELGNEMAEFERLDEAVHAASLQLHKTAESGPPQDVLTRLNEVQRGCVACHARFRERLRTAPAARPIQ